MKFDRDFWIATVAAFIGTATFIIGLILLFDVSGICKSKKGETPEEEAKRLKKCHVQYTVGLVLVMSMIIGTGILVLVVATIKLKSGSLVIV